MVRFLPQRFLILAFLMGMGLAAMPQSAPAEEATQQALSPADELKMWNDIKSSSDPAAYEKYLMLFPNGMFFDPAKAKWEQLSGKTYVGGATATPAQPQTASTGTAASQPEPVVVKNKPLKKSATSLTKKKRTGKTAKLKSKKKVASNKVLKCKKPDGTKIKCLAKKKTKPVAVAAKVKKPVTKSPVTPADESNGKGGGSGGTSSW